jgi:hypothetical protein
LAGVVGLLILSAFAPPARARILIPMDLSQTDHLKAYGIAYWVLTQGHTLEWLLNYRGGSFLLEDDPEVVREARIRGVSAEVIDEAGVDAIHAEIEGSNMDAILLEKAPRVAIYIPPGFVPWDDAVTLAFSYAEIPYTAIWDEEVLRGSWIRWTGFTSTRFHLGGKFCRRSERGWYRIKAGEAQAASVQKVTRGKGR